MSNKVFGYIIVCAGSAGYVLANRLSANPSHQVLVLEAGPGRSSRFCGRISKPITTLAEPAALIIKVILPFADGRRYAIQRFTNQKLYSTSPGT